jgi:asparagine synthase (glutamine-hydrolysing)
MCDAIRHRGPDDEGMLICEGVALGMRRLAVIDVEGGQQPLANEDGSVVTVFNGEIYNFRQLRVELESRGHRFATRSDTEVIVHAYEEYGDDFVGRLNGMFALALFDRRQRRLLLARDPLGIKPLYLGRVGDLLVWGSEIKAVLASGVVPRRLDVDALGQFLAWEYVPGEGTLLRDVRRLRPAEITRVDLDSGRIRCWRYWDLPLETAAHSPQDWDDLLDEHVRLCTRRQMVADVPLGAFLSGGVDSSLVAAAMGQVQTFSIGFDDPTYNELGYSRRVSEHLGVQHRTEVLSPDLIPLFQRLMHHMDDPIGDFSIFPTYLVSVLARRHVTVALSGDGADELFGGYETYVAHEKARMFQRLPAFLRQGVLVPAVAALRPRPAKKGLVNKAKRFVEGMGEPEVLGHARWRVFVSEVLRRRLFTPAAQAALLTPVEAHIERLQRDAGRRDAVNRGLYVDVFSYLTDNCLAKVDRMSMATSLEVRVPYLDVEMVEFAFRMPGRFKLQNGVTKAALKRVAARHVPGDCVYRPKEGFSIPIKRWLCRELRPVLEQALDETRLRQQGLFNLDTVRRLKAEHLQGRANHSHALWSLVVFQTWCDRWLRPA